MSFWPLLFSAFVCPEGQEKGGKKSFYTNREHVKSVYWGLQYRG